MGVRRPFLLWVLLFLVARVACGDIHAARVDGDGRGAWALILLEFPPQSGDASITLRDARGGIEVVRAVPAGSSRLLLPLPLIAPAQLVRGVWPLEATLQSNGGTVDQSRVAVQISTEEMFRVAVPEGTPDALFQPVRWQALTRKPVAFITLPASEISAGPPLLFAATDAVLLAEGHELSDARQLAILSAGARLVRMGNAPGTGARAGELVWDRLASAEGHDLWVLPALPLRHPVIIEPEVEQLGRLTSSPPAPPAHLLAATFLVGPAAIVAVLLARGLFKRSHGELLATGVAVVVVSAGFVAYLRASDSGSIETVTFRQATARPDATVGGVFIEEQRTTRTSFLDHTGFTLRTNDGCLLSLVTTPRAYFALRDQRLILRDGETTLEGTSHGRDAVRTISTSAHAGPLLPEFPATPDAQQRLAQSLSTDLAKAHWVTGGYVYPGNTLPAEWHDGKLFTGWAGEQSPVVAQAARTWYAIRFDATHRYFMWQAGDVLAWIDYGISP